MKDHRQKPDWNLLFGTASAQEGYFTTGQAAEAGYSTQLLFKPITNPRRTLNDCAREAMSPDLLRQAAQQAIRRGLVTKTELGDVEEVLGFAHRVGGVPEGAADGAAVDGPFGHVAEDVAETVPIVAVGCLVADPAELAAAAPGPG